MTNRVYDSADITLDGSDAESWRVLKGLNVVETISKVSDYRTSVDVSSSTLYVTCAGDTFSINYSSLANAQTAQNTIDGFRIVAGGSGSGGATDALQEEQIRCTINETIVPTNTNGATLLIGANPNRTVLTVFNNHGAVLWISSNNPAVVNTMRVPANSPISFDAPVPVDALYCRTQSGIGTALVVEGEAV